MVLLIHAHPEAGSFTSVIAAAAAGYLEQAGAEVRKSNLYSLTDSSGSGNRVMFPAVLNAEELRRKTSLDEIVQAQMALVEEAEAYIIVHPDWWGGPPAILKGWIDRVFRPGTAYEIPEGYGHRDPEGLLAGKKALVIITGDGMSPGPLKDFWIDRVWGYCGVKASVQYFPDIRSSSEKRRREFLGQLEKPVRALI